MLCPNKQKILLVTMRCYIVSAKFFSHFFNLNSHFFFWVTDSKIIMFLSAFLCLNFRNICFFFNDQKCCLIHLQKLHAYYIRLRLILPVWQICSILKSNLQCLYWSLGSVFAYRKINVFLTHIIIPVTSSAGWYVKPKCSKKVHFFSY